LTNVDPIVTAPTLWYYAVCGHVPGRRWRIGESHHAVYLPHAGVQIRYLIVQFLITELEVYIRCKFCYMHRHYRTDSTSELEKQHTLYVRIKYVYAAPIFLSCPLLFLAFDVILKMTSLSVKYLTYTNNISLANINNNKQGGTLPTAVQCLSLEVVGN